MSNMNYHKVLLICAFVTQTMLCAYPIFKHNHLVTGVFYNETRIVCFDDNHEIGYISYTKAPFFSYYILHTFYVHPTYRKQGYGTQLLNYASNYVEQLGAQKIYVQPGPFEINKNGYLIKPKDDSQEKLKTLVSFYEQHGFTPASTALIYCAQMAYYSISLDENANYLMVKNIQRDSMQNTKSTKKMDAREVIELLKLFEEHSIMVHVDGGWGVDALLGKQTRPHGDLDIAIEHKNVPMLRTLLAQRGYQEIPRDDTSECNFVLQDRQGHEIDVHSYTFDAQGNNTFGVAYPYESLTGTGIIGGHKVKCISPEWMVKFHTGYELDENDYHDVSALCKHFGIPLPKEYEKFTLKKKP